MTDGLVKIAWALFRAARGSAAETSVSDGDRWERNVASSLRAAGARVGQLPGTSMPFGFRSMSGLPHQLDLAASVLGALFLLEMKAHRRVVPKNDLLRFVAASEDCYLGLGPYTPSQPLYRVLVSIAPAAASARLYAAVRGVGIIDGALWPAPVLASSRLTWPDGTLPPAPEERAALNELVRPMQADYVVRASSAAVRYASVSRMAWAVRLQQEWSERADQAARAGGEQWLQPPTIAA